MKGIAFKSLAIVMLIAFGFMLVPQQAEAQINWECLLLTIGCVLANAAAEVICVAQPKACAAAQLFAALICAAAEDACA